MMVIVSDFFLTFIIFTSLSFVARKKSSMWVLCEISE